MDKTFTIEEIKALYNMYQTYEKEWNDALDNHIHDDNAPVIKNPLTFHQWLDVHEQGNDELIYY